MTGGALRGERVELVAVAPAHVESLRRILHTPEVHARWGDDDAEPSWPFDDPDAERFAIVVEGQVVGLVQFAEQTEPRYRHASIDLYVDPAVHGQGIGRDAVGTIARHLIMERGHHRLTIDPAADNEPAIRCYQAVGFRPVGVLRRYERGVGDDDTWHDGLLMELIADDLVR